MNEENLLVWGRRVDQTQWKMWEAGGRQADRDNAMPMCMDGCTNE